MANVSIESLPEITSLADADHVVVDDVSAPQTTRITAANLVADIHGRTSPSDIGAGPERMSFTVESGKTTDTLADSDNNTWTDVDTDALGADHTVTVPTGLTVGTVAHYSKKGTGGNVVFAAGVGMTLRGGTTLSDENGVAAVFITASGEAIIMGNVA